MKQSVVFSTPGLIPIEAFTVFGMNAKPNSTNPFGFFGTGLKIAIAVCMRYEQEVVIWRGRDKYTFYTKKTDFRGTEFNKIRMKLETHHLSGLFKKSYHDLPFTTQLGKHWELWQAYREFQTNTMDESGTTCLSDELTVHDWHPAITTNMSRVVVTGQKFVDEYHDRERNFLPDGLTVREGSDRIQVLDRPSRHVYYRGVRVWDLKEEAQFTYNFLMSVDLTEDRTAKHPFLLEAYICEHIMQSKDESFVERTVGSPTGFEKSLPYRYTSVQPSATFTAVAINSPVTGAKELVRAVETVSSSTRIILTIPKPNITDQEMEELHTALSNVFGDIKLEQQS